MSTYWELLETADEESMWEFIHSQPGSVEGTPHPPPSTPFLYLNPSPVSPALPSQWWTSWAPARARRCILPTGKSRQVARSVHSQSKTVYSGKGRRTSRAIGCSPSSSCTGSHAWSPLYARPPTETARALRCNGRSSAFCRFRGERKVGQPPLQRLSLQAHVRWGMRVNLTTERSAAQRRRGARKSCTAGGSASIREVIVRMSECRKHLE